MSWRIAGLVLVPIIFAVVGLTSSLVLQSMVDEVNQRRAPEHRISPYGWYPGKMLSVVAAYRESCPHGRRHVQLGALVALVAITFVLGAVCL
jgi:hypothetical protein